MMQNSMGKGCTLKKVNSEIKKKSNFWTRGNSVILVELGKITKIPLSRVRKL